VGEVHPMGGKPESAAVLPKSQLTRGPGSKANLKRNSPPGARVPSPKKRKERWGKKDGGTAKNGGTPMEPNS